MNPASRWSLLRRQVARRTWLLGFLPLLAACQSSYSPAEPVRFEGRAVQLTARSVRESRRVALKVTAKEAPTPSPVPPPGEEQEEAPPVAAEDIEFELISLSFEVHHRWKNLSEKEMAVRPWFRVRVVDERDKRIVAERAVMVGDSRDAVHPLVLGNPPIEVCRFTRRCEATFRLEFERQELELVSQEPPSESTLSSTWSVIANAQASNADGERLDVTLSER
ncbi:hypothetical protein [Hyalangium gracile]|uniref:hypothetical protein n=1 Tax=Hyalangium gracile TaxID=394092 RepID=UPI001CCDD588|nr:hypothetical protein [Hyalangium gracile]